MNQIEMITARPNRPLSPIHRSALLVLLVMFSLAPSVASAVVPGEVNYQGLLLDDSGMPVVSPSDFEFRLFDVETAGSALWTESHSSVPVVDGVYDVVLGSITPIPPTVLATGTLYLEIAVDSETLSPRQRLLAVPYALRAAVAEVAETTTNVGAFDSAFFEAVLVNTDWDGAPPDNFHPSEGLPDVDGDGTPNFMDSDNDGDGIPDANESIDDINLITPILTDVAPTTLRDDLPSTVTITGANFQASMNVQVGPELGSVSNVTPTSADVAIGVHPAGPAEDVSVTLANGQTATLSSAIQFFVLMPTLTSISPDLVDANTSVTISVVGTNFEAGMTVQIGAEIGALSNLTPTSVDVLIDSSHGEGFEDVTVTLANGASATLNNALAVASDPRTIFVTSSTHTGNLGGLIGADAICNARASTAGLSGTFQAWLSDAVDSPLSRSTQSPSPYATVTSSIIAVNWPNLVDGDIDAPIDIDENGVNVGSVLAWSAVNPNTGGSGPTVECSAWTSESGFGGTGSSSDTNFLWSFADTTQCSETKHLYCIEQ